MKKFLPAQKVLENFTIEKSLTIDELNVDYIEVVHRPTQAKIIHIQNDDPDNLFCLSFPTYPESSNGAPHVLEHVVLCGSKKFPVKDPFFSMLRRSLNTFMNAMTGADFTCYPASSEVEKDFYHLLDVYLDAVFFPEIRKTSFLQEGYRLDYHEKEEKLFHEGVVFNEMSAGAYHFEEKLWHTMLANLFPDLSYRFDSGGDPKIIPTLTHEALLRFHQKYYHPSLCLFFFYGNLPIEKHLDFIEKRVLSKTKASEFLPKLVHQKKWGKKTPKPIFSRYALTKKEKESDGFGLGFLTCPIEDQKELLSILILDMLLMDNDGSLLKREILASKLCHDTFSLIDPDMSDIPWIFVAVGCEEKNFESFKNLLFSVLKHLVEKHTELIEEKLLRACLHQIEFSKSEITGGKSPFGLKLFFQAGLLRQHGCSGEKGLMIHSLFKEIEKELNNSSFWANLIQKYLLNNISRVDLILKGDEKLEAEENLAQRKLLDEKLKGLSLEEKQKLLQENESLLDYQKSLERQSLDCLPKLDLKDVPKNSKHYGLMQCKDNIFYHSTFTNHIMGCDAYFDFNHIVEKDNFSRLGLLTDILFDLGAKKRDFKENLFLLQSYTGGASASINLQPLSKDPSSFLSSLKFSSKALDRNTQKCLELMHDTIAEANFKDQDRLEELLLQITTALEQSLPKMALDYAKLIAFNDLDPIAAFSHHLSGLGYYHYLQNLKKASKSARNEEWKKLEKIQKDIVEKNAISYVVTGEEKFFDVFQKHSKELFSKKPKQNDFFSRSSSFLEKKKSFAQGYVIPSSVASTVMAYHFPVSFDDFDSSQLMIIAKLFEHITLHPKIREQGGAYGGKAIFAPLSGSFCFYSYRDPHLKTTLDAFFEAIETICEKKFTAAELEEAKLSVIQDLDSPIAPLRRGPQAFSYLRANLSLEERNHFRKNILEATKETIISATEKQFSKNLEPRIVTFASKKFLETELIKLDKKFDFEIIEF